MSINLTFDAIMKEINRISNTITYNELLHERYLHHYFSFIIQNKAGIKLAESSNVRSGLHPEWPTYKKTTGIRGGCYKKNKELNIYEVSDMKSGNNAGHVDFAYGDYEHPRIGIEFKLGSFSREGITFDLMKLIDPRNKFHKVISHSIILLKGPLCGIGDQTFNNRKRDLESCYTNAINRLSKMPDPTIEKLYYLVTELDSFNNRRHWLYNGGRKEAISMNTVDFEEMSQ